MKGFGCYSLPAALEMTRADLEHIAREIGVTVERLDAARSGDAVLSLAEAARLTAFLWRSGVFIIDTPVFEAAVRIAAVVRLRSWMVFAEHQADTKSDGLGFRLFAKCWCAWLRLRGLGHRIGPWPVANAVRTCRPVTAEALAAAVRLGWPPALPIGADLAEGIAALGYRVDELAKARFAREHGASLAPDGKMIFVLDALPDAIWRNAWRSNTNGVRSASGRRSPPWREGA
jgi:hypothetical protein